MRAIVRAVLFISAFIATGEAALANKRAALVIGNSAYIDAAPLANPKNDATDMAEALRKLGFTVILGIDLDKRAMEGKILEFSKALSGADAGVFHYSGHGLQVAGVNYLVPIDAKLESPAALDFEMVRLDLVQRTMERETKTNILFLDACRNNPLSRSLARALGTRSADIGQGLAPAELGVGTLISFSTQPGNVALDGSGRNSPYSGPLIKAIGTPGEDILSVLTDVRNNVLAATDEKQVPWENHALRARFYFNPAPAPANVPAPSAPLSEVVDAWTTIKERKDIAIFDAFRRQYGAANPFYDTMAATRIEELRREQKPPVEPARETMPAADFILPDSDRRPLTAAELARFSKSELRLARNEIYARRGRFFVSVDLQQYFGKFAWYRPFAKEPKLSAIEEQNVKLIEQLEKSR